MGTRRRIFRAWKSWERERLFKEELDHNIGQRRFIPDRKVISSLTPRPFFGARICPVLLDICCPGLTGAGHTVPTNACNESPTTCFVARSAEATGFSCNPMQQPGETALPLADAPGCEIATLH